MKYYTLTSNCSFDMIRIKKLTAKVTAILICILFTHSPDIFAYQQITVSGTVTDGQKQPIPGVTVRLKNSQAGTLTDNNGKYNINVPNQDAVLIFSFVGFISQEIQVKQAKTINPVLREDAKGLDEVVVIGYGSVNKRDLAGSVSSIKGEELRKSNTPTVQEAIQGKVAGLQITSNSGEPGAGINIMIRGNNSVNAGSQPLYVIDGVQIDVNTGEVGGHRFGSNVRYNPLSNINPSDIKSIEILKDAAATAIFGSRGASGVIIITTKEGGGDKNTVELDMYAGISSKVNTMDMLSGQEFAQYRFDISPAPNLIYGEDTDGDGTGDRVRDFSGREVNWQNEVLRIAPVQSYNLTINSGGYSNLRLSTTVGYLNQAGIVDKNNYERYTGRMRANYKMSNKLNIGGALNFSHSASSGVTATAGGGQYFGIVESFVLFRPIITPEGDELGNPDNGGLSNPRIFIDDAYKHFPNNRLFFDGFASYNLAKYLDLRISGGGMISNTKGREWYPSTTSWGYTRNGLAMLNEIQSNSWQTSNTLTYARSFPGQHYINAVIGYELNSFKFNSLSTRAEDFINQNFNPIYDIGQASTFPENVQSSFWDVNRESQFMRVNYSFQDRFLFTGSVRRDGSSIFGRNNKYAWFPAAGLAWKLNRESFLKDVKKLDELKLRTSFGLSGNDRIDSYRSLSRTEKAYYANGQGNSDLGLAPSEIENPNLKWETTRQVNAGLDILLFDKRIGVIIDWYKKWTFDMLLRADVPSQIGSYRQWQNIGSVNNEGFEFGLNTTNIDSKNFQWTTNFNISFNRNKVVSLGGGSAIPVTISGGHIQNIGIVKEGYPIGSIWGYEYGGVYQTSDFNTDGSRKPGVQPYPGAMAQPGDMKFKDLDNDGNVTPDDDKAVIANFNPKHTGGFTNSFKHKQLDLNVFLQWSYGNDIMNLGRYRYEGYIPYYNISREYYSNRWTADNPTNQYPELRGLGKTESSSYYVEDGSYLRLKNVSVGYTLSSGFVKKLKINNLRMYVSAENLVTWTNYSGFDPEVSFWNPLISGVDYISYPRPRTFTFGLNVKF